MAASPQNSPKRTPPGANSPAIVICGGPSLKGFDFEGLRGRPCYAANKAAFFAPWAELVSIDRDFCFNFTKEIADFGPRAHLAPPDNIQDRNPAARHYRRERSADPFDCPADVLPGLNSGFAALALAIKHGHRDIAVLGLDMKPNQGHFHSGYPWNPKQIDGIIGAWVDQFDRLADQCARRGVKVVNFNPDSAVTRFQKMPLGDLYGTFLKKESANDMDI